MSFVKTLQQSHLLYPDVPSKQEGAENRVYVQYILGLQTDCQVNAYLDLIDHFG